MYQEKENDYYISRLLSINRYMFVQIYFSKSPVSVLYSLKLFTIYLR